MPGRTSPASTAALLVLLAPLAAVGSQQQDGTANQTGPAALKKLSLEQLSEIEVTSPSREPRPAFRSPVAIYVITGEDIRRAGVRTIPDALRLAPGVEVAQIDASKWSVGIRGFGTRLSRDVLVLIDGRTVYTPLFAGTYWEVQDTLLEDIDRIEIIRGPGGTIWGPNAVNGVINIITKSSKETQGAYVQGGGGNQEQGFLSARYGGDAGGGLTWRVYAKAFDRGPEYHPDHDNFDDWLGTQGGFRMDWGAGRDAFTVTGDMYGQEDGERVSLSTYTPPANATVDGNADLNGGNILFRWKRTLGEGDDLQLQTYYDQTDRYEPNLGENRHTWDLDYLQREKLPWRQELSWGVEGRASGDHFLEVISGLVFSPFHRTDSLISGFLEDDINLIDGKLLLTAGSKVLRTNYTGFDAQPSVRLLWTPTESQAFWVAFTHAVRTPSDAEEDFYLSSLIGAAPGGIPIFARFNANPNFAPEQLNGYEFGYRRMIGKKLYVDFASFYNRYHNLFSEDLAGTLFVETGLPFPTTVPASAHVLLPAQFRNSLYGDTAGGEIAPEWRPVSFWRLRGSYSYLHMDLHKVPNAIVAQTPEAVEGSSPQHEGSIDSSFDLPRRLKLDLVYRVVSALPAQNVPAYSTGDVRLAWRLREHVEFSVVGRNLFQREHVEYIGDPGPPVGIVRNVFASLAWLGR